MGSNPPSPTNRSHQLLRDIINMEVFLGVVPGERWPRESYYREPEQVTERTYKNDEIRVDWVSQLCTHCEACFKGLPQVFDPVKRPWVNMAGAPTEEIIKQVEQCPSGALTYVKLGDPNG